MRFANAVIAIPFTTIIFKIALSIAYIAGNR